MIYSDTLETHDLLKYITIKTELTAWANPVYDKLRFNVYEYRKWQKNAQTSHMEDTVCLKWYVSRLFKYTLDLFSLSKRSNSWIIFRKTFHVISNISW